MEASTTRRLLDRLMQGDLGKARSFGGGRDCFLVGLERRCAGSRLDVGLSTCSCKGWRKLKLAVTGEENQEERRVDGGDQKRNRGARRVVLSVLLYVRLKEERRRDGREKQEGDDRLRWVVVVREGSERGGRLRGGREVKRTQNWAGFCWPASRGPQPVPQPANGRPSPLNSPSSPPTSDWAGTQSASPRRV